MRYPCTCADDDVCARHHLACDRCGRTVAEDHLTLEGDALVCFIDREGCLDAVAHHADADLPLEWDVDALLAADESFAAICEARNDRAIIEQERECAALARGLRDVA